jgi:triacylglycerol lipase
VEGNRSRRLLTAVLSIATLAFSLAACLIEEDDPDLDEAEAPGPDFGPGPGGPGGGRRPVIFVHGCPPPPATNAQDSTFALPAISYFQSRGYPADRLFRFVSPDPVCNSSLTQAMQLAAFVQNVRNQTGADKVDIIAHSIGAITSRLYIAAPGSRVDHFVSVGGANHGSGVAAVAVEWQAAFGAPAYEGAKEMFPPYACQGQTVQAADVQFVLNGCLTPTGRTVARDETPGNTKVLSIRNSLDEIVQPHGSECLNQRRQNDCADRVNVEVTVASALGPCGPGGAQAPCPAHVSMMFDPGVMQRMFNFVTDNQQ